MANYRHYARRVARQNGIPPRLFMRLISAESGWNPGAVSPAGAIGFAQLMPGTASGLGVDPFNPKQNILGGARYLADQYRRFGRWDLALAAYNAGPGAVEAAGGIPDFSETQAYVKKIMSGIALGASGSPGGTNTRSGPADAVDGLTEAPSGMSDPLASAQEALGGITSGQNYDPLAQLAELAGGAAMGATMGGGVPSPQEAAAAGGNPAHGKVNVGKWVSLSPGADRAGVSTQKPVLKIVAQIARIYGHPLTIGTGTNHNEYTVDGNVSAHWTGMAADIPATGAALTRLGRAALRAVGVGRAQARKMARQGGLFNIGNFQIIFKTTEGGNHWNHLHVGIRG